MSAVWKKHNALIPAISSPPLAVAAEQRGGPCAPHELSGSLGCIQAVHVLRHAVKVSLLPSALHTKPLHEANQLGSDLDVV